jgi:hypothetical protein
MLSTALTVGCFILEWWIARHWLVGDASIDDDDRRPGGGSQFQTASPMSSDR